MSRRRKIIFACCCLLILYVLLHFVLSRITFYNFNKHYNIDGYNYIPLTLFSGISQNLAETPESIARYNNVATADLCLRLFFLPVAMVDSSMTGLHYGNIPSIDLSVSCGYVVPDVQTPELVEPDQPLSSEPKTPDETLF